MKTLTKDQLSLLLYLETCAVDARGVVDQLHMNADDCAQAEEWTKTAFIFYRRRPMADFVATERKQPTHVVTLSPKAWKLVHAERRARAERHLPIGIEASQ